MVAGARTRRALFLCLAVASIAAGVPARADNAASGAPSEYQVKAAYLYYFATFVNWPPETFSGDGDALVVGVLGEDPFGSVLDDTLRGKTVGRRQLVVRRLGNIREARDCHVLFISASERDRLASIFKELEGAAILTVGEADRFASRGGQIAFRMEDKKVRFDINASAVERARLKVSAQLMKLGRIVEGTDRRGG